MMHRSKGGEENSDPDNDEYAAANEVQRGWEDADGVKQMKTDTNEERAEPEDWSWGEDLCG